MLLPCLIGPRRPRLPGHQNPRVRLAGAPQVVLVLAPDLKYGVTYSPVQPVPAYACGRDAAVSPAPSSPAADVQGGDAVVGPQYSPVGEVVGSGSSRGSPGGTSTGPHVQCGVTSSPVTQPGPSEAYSGGEANLLAASSPIEAQHEDAAEPLQCSSVVGVVGPPCQVEHQRGDGKEGRVEDSSADVDHAGTALPVGSGEEQGLD